MNVHWALQALIGCLLGALGTGLHLDLLRRHLAGAMTLEGIKARGMLLRGYPLRLGLWVPSIAIALWIGPLACMTMLIAGACVRWIMLRTSATHRMAD